MNEAIFILNGVNVTAETQGLETLRERIYYDDELRGYLREMGGEVTLTGDAFRFVQQRFKTNFDSPIPCNVSVLNPHTEIIESVFNGVIFPADCEFDLYAKQVTCQLVDTTFFAKIDNNKNLKFTLNAGLSKLGVDITNRGGEIDYQNISRLWTTTPIMIGFLVSPETGILTKATTLYQALDYLVAAMTDGEVEFFSAFLTDSATDPNYVVMSGEQVRMANTQSARRVYVSWSELFGDLSRQFNLLMAVEEFQPNRFRIRVEPFEFWKQQQITDLFEVKPRVKERIDTAMLPASVLVGSAKVEKKLPIPSADLVNKSPIYAANFWVPTNTSFYFDFVPETPFIYHWQEEYNYDYQSNVDTPQNLRHSVCITDTKLYQYQVSQYWARFPIVGFNTEQDVDASYDEDVFLIHSTAEINLGIAIVRRPVAYLEPLFTMINRDINNVNTMQRNITSVPASAVLLFSQFGTQSFRSYYVPSGTQPILKRSGSNYHLVMINDSVGADGDWIGNTTYGGTALTPVNSPLTIFAGTSSQPQMSLVAGFNSVAPPGFDTSGAPGWDTTNYYWTCTVAALYTFKLSLKYLITRRNGAVLGSEAYCGVLMIWDSSGTILKGINTINCQLGVKNGITFILKLFGQLGGNNNQAGEFNWQSSPHALLPGDKVQVIMLNAWSIPGLNATNSTVGLWLRDDSYFEISGSSLPEAGGTALTKNTGSTFLIENELEADVPLNVWNQIKANPFAKFYYQVADDGEGRTAFLKDFDREIISGRFNGITQIQAAEQEDIGSTLQTEPGVEPEIPEEPDEE